MAITVGRAVLGHALEIGGDVVVGEGVVLAAVPRNDLGELAWRDRLGALEHQMLEEMGNAGRAARLVGGADLVPDHLGHDRSAMVGDDQDLKTVAEREFDDAGARLGAVHRHGKGHGGEAEGGEDQARTSIERARKLIEHRHHHGS